MVTPFVLSKKLIERAVLTNAFTHAYETLLMLFLGPSNMLAPVNQKTDVLPAENF